MPQSNILKEFLVRIGFKVDDEQYKRFQNTWKGVGQTLANVGATAVATATAVTYATIRTAEGLEKLYYGAQRTGDSVKNLQAFRYAAEQIGISASDAGAAVEQMAKILRNSPGHNALLASMGIDPRQGTTQKFLQLAQILVKLQRGGPAQHARAAALAQQFGISEEMLTMLSQPGALDKFRAAEQTRIGLMAKNHVNPDQVAAQSRDFMNEVRQTQASFQDIRELSATRLIPTLEKVNDLFQKMIGILGPIDSMTGGLSTQVGTVAAGFGVSKIIGSIIKKLFGKGGAVGAGEGAAVGEGAAGLGLADLIPVVGIGAALGYGVQKGDEKYGTSIRKKLGLTDDPATNRRIIANKIRGFMGGAVSAVNDVADPILAAFTAKNEGYSATPYNDAGGKSIGYGHHLRPGENISHLNRGEAFALLLKDMAATVAKVKAVVKAKLNSNQMAALDDLAYNIGAGAFQKSTLLKDINSGHLENINRDFHMFNKIKQQDGTYLRSSALDARRSSEVALFNKNPQFNQKTTVHVSTADPNVAAKAVAREQRNVNGQMVRQMAGALDTVGN